MTNNHKTYNNSKDNKMKQFVNKGNKKEQEDSIKKIIDNELFDKNNLLDISSDNEDKFDDLYSIIKIINFNSVLLNNEGIFSVENKDYKNYQKRFKRIFNFKMKKFKSYIKGNSESTKMNTTSSKKISFHKENKEKYIQEFKLDNIIINENNNQIY